jgi:hypothetical protein
MPGANGLLKLSESMGPTTRYFGVAPSLRRMLVTEVVTSGAGLGRTRWTLGLRRFPERVTGDVYRLRGPRRVDLRFRDGHPVDASTGWQRR